MSSLPDSGFDPTRYDATPPLTPRTPSPLAVRRERKRRREEEEEAQRLEDQRLEAERLEDQRIAHVERLAMMRHDSRMWDRARTDHPFYVRM